MVAKINRGASLYGAVAYNQQKVDDAAARIIAGNRMMTDLTGNPHNVMQQTLWAFESYLEHGEAGAAHLPEPLGRRPSHGRAVRGTGL